MATWMIYGANGYQGNLIASEAKRRGMAPILAGRHAATISRLGESLGLESRGFELADPKTVAQHLAGVTAVLNCAGPFSATSAPLLAGCLQARAHYLDITGEIDVFESIFARAAEVREAGIIALPGVGFDVVPSDCLAALLHRALPDATSLRMAFMSHYGKLSPGTARTSIEGIGSGLRVRMDGKIVEVPPQARRIRFTESPHYTVGISWGDVATAYHSTGIPNIEMFIGATPAQTRLLQPSRFLRWMLKRRTMQAIVKGGIRRSVKGPTEAERQRDEMLLWGEVTNADGQRRVMRMRTPEGYATTTETALAAVNGLLAGRLAPGVYTPSLAFGPEFVLGLPGVTLTPGDD
jgi:short subunit dehydrogenase-like uncharacterized protein